MFVYNQVFLHLMHHPNRCLHFMWHSPGELIGVPISFYKDTSGTGLGPTLTTSS